MNASAAEQQQGEPMTINEIMQILTNLVERDGAHNAERHRELVDRSLERYSDKVIEAPETESCTICLEPVNVYLNLPCGHAFHRACLRSWLEAGKFDCPVCRQIIISDVSPFASSSSSTNTSASAASIPQGIIGGAATRVPSGADARRDQALALI